MLTFNLYAIVVQDVYLIVLAGTTLPQILEQKHARFISNYCFRKFKFISNKIVETLFMGFQYWKLSDGW